jgi:stringent starvation protein B
LKSRKPYLLRAMHEWISDSEYTPHIVADAGVTGVDVPRQYVRDGKIILNVSWNATADLEMGNEEVRFSARFGGASRSVRLPIDAVLAIYARETGQGMIFTDEEGEAAPKPPPDTPPEPPPKPRGGRAKLKVVK